MGNSTYLLLLLFFLTTSNLYSQVWTALNVPMEEEFYNFEIVVSPDNQNKALIPNQYFDDSLYTQIGNGSWAAQFLGRVPAAFYTPGGKLFLLRDPNQSIEPPMEVLMSTDNGMSFVPVENAHEDCFHLDQDNNIFFATSEGFMYSTDEGESFSQVNTDWKVTSAALSSSGDLYYGSDSLRLFRSSDGGLTWLDISKTLISSTRIRELQVRDDVIYFDDSSGSYRYGTESDDYWWSTQPATIGTSWVGNMHIYSEGFFIQSPYGLYSSPTWPEQGSNWNLLMAGFDSDATAYGAYAGDYDLSDTHVYVRVEEGFVHSDIESTVSHIEEQEIVLQIFPNPTDGGVQVWLNDGVEGNIEVYDINGKLVQRVEHRIGTKALIELPKASGLYGVRVNTNQGPSRMQLVIRK